jgi:hypothetical protein
LIDTGSSVTIISDAALKSICPNRILMLDRYTGPQLQAINDTPVQVLGTIELSFDNIKPLKCLVVPDLYNEFVIGLDSLKRGFANIDLLNRKMRWYDHSFDMIPYHNLGTYVGACTERTIIESVKTLLDKYPEIFNDKSMPDPIKTDQKMHIDTGDNKPIKCQAYRPPLRKTHILENQISQMVEAGILEPCTSPWASPCLLVPKPDGSHRLVGSFVKLNKLTTPDTYPLPKPQHIFDGLRGSQYFTTLDMKKGYFLMELDEESQLKAAVTCHLGTFKYKRAAMGLKNSGAQFCRIIESILRPFIGRFCYVYVDDILCYSRTLNDHLKHLRLILDKLKEAHVQLRKSKCFFARKEINFLGYRVSADGIFPIQDKLDPILKAPTPTSKKVTKFFGKHQLLQEIHSQLQFLDSTNV